MVAAEDLVHPSDILGRDGRLGVEPVIEEMISAALMALVNERLEIQDDVGIGRAQRNADGWQAFAQGDGVDFAFGGSLGSKDRDSIAGGLLLEDIPNALRENGGALAHQVYFHEVDPAADEGVTFSKIAIAISEFEFVGRAEEFEHGNQAAGRIANLDPAFDLFVRNNSDRFRGRRVRGRDSFPGTGSSYSCSAR
jgi:hypothetical protein